MESEQIDGQMDIFDFIRLDPIREPCNRRCPVEWGSLKCFLLRGYMRYDGKWARNEHGDILITKSKECDWIPKGHTCSECEHFGGIYGFEGCYSCYRTFYNKNIKPNDPACGYFRLGEENDR